MKQNRGFSLIEALVVVGVLAILGVLLTDLLSRTFRGGNKTQLIGIVKQNGQSALNIMDNTIRSSSKVFCVDTYDVNNNIQNPSQPFKDTIIIVGKDGIYTRFRFYVEKKSSLLNGYIGQYQLATPSDPTTLDPTTLCKDTTRTGELKLTTDDPSGGISLKDGNFTYTSNPGFKDVVAITFNLGPNVNASSTKSENSIGSTNKVNFSTTVELR